jgi:hypothetical protein
VKKVLAITLLLLLCATVASAANQNSWRVLLKADNGITAGGSAGPGAYVGVYPTSIEGKDAQDGSAFSFGTDVPGTTNIIEAIVPGEVAVYGKSIKAPTEPLPEKVWDLYVAGNWNASNAEIRLTAYTVNNALPTPEFLPNQPAPSIHYFVRMVDNQEVAGAPANGTMWELPIPTVHSTTMFWSSPVNLPMLRLSVGSSNALITEGYHIQFVQQCVPEPSGLLALGAGLMGLVGFVSRRRR